GSDVAPEPSISGPQRGEYSAVQAVLEGRITNGTTVSALLALHAVRIGAATDRAEVPGDRSGRHDATAHALRPADAPFMLRPGRD
ncbi:hypothetical protein ACFFHZ_09495, partial [Brachybacterium muris]